jgi:hypothetical protein
MHVMNFLKLFKNISKTSFLSRKDSAILQKPRWSSDKTTRMVSVTRDGIKRRNKIQKRQTHREKEKRIVCMQAKYKKEKICY